MNQIIAINGSPKKKNGTSSTLIEELEECLMGTKMATYPSLTLLHDENHEDILQADTLIIVFPLYIDALPSHLISLLKSLETAATKTSEPKPRLFAVCVCGFYEGFQTKTALNILRNFAEKTGFHWQYGIGIGSGGYLAEVKNLAQGPTKNVHTALRKLAEDILKNTDESHVNDIFVTPKIPRFLYRLGGHIGWRKLARTNGVKLKSI